MPYSNAFIIILTTVNLHAESCFADSKLSCVSSVEAVDTVSTNNAVLSLTINHSTVPATQATSAVCQLIN